MACEAEKQAVANKIALIEQIKTQLNAAMARLKQETNTVDSILRTLQTEMAELNLLNQTAQTCLGG